MTLEQLKLLREWLHAEIDAHLEDLDNDANDFVEGGSYRKKLATSLYEDLEKTCI